MDDISRRYDQAVLITRNNAWLVPRTCEIAGALASHGIKIALIAYTGSSQAFIEGDKVAPQLTAARRWIDEYFEQKFIPWLEQRVGDLFNTPESSLAYLGSGYLPLNALAHKYGLPNALKIEKMGDAGRKQYHDAVTALPKLERTLGISVDTRLLIGADTLRVVPHHGFHPGRMRIVRGDETKALGESTTLRMVKGGETRLQVAAHLLGNGLDNGGVIGQYTFDINPRDESMFAIRDHAYRGLIEGYIRNVLPNVLDSSNPAPVIYPQGEGPEYPDIDRDALHEFSPGWKSSDKAPPKQLIRVEEFFAALQQLLPPSVSITEIPDPLSIGITTSQLCEFARSIGPRSLGEVARGVVYDEYRGEGIS